MRAGRALALGLVVACAVLATPDRVAAEGIDVTPLAWDYGEVEVGESSPVVFTLTSTEPVPLTVESVTIDDDETGSFSITSASPPPSVLLYQGEFVDVEVLFSPSEAGSHTASLHIVSDAEPPDTILDVPLQGIGDQAFPDGYIYVASWQDDHVLEYDADYELQSTWTHPSFADDLAGMAFDADGNLVVSSLTDFCVFSEPGVLIACHPKAVAARTENIIFHSNGHLYATSSTQGNNVVQKYDSDYDLVASLAMPSSALTGITCDPDGYLYVSSQGAGAIYKADPDSGAVVDTITGFPASGYGIEGLQYTGSDALLAVVYNVGVAVIEPSSPLTILDTFADGNLLWPVPVTIDNAGNVYTADFENSTGTNPADLFTFDSTGSVIASKLGSEVYAPFGTVVAGVRLPCGPRPRGVLPVMGELGLLLLGAGILAAGLRAVRVRTRGV